MNIGLLSEFYYPWSGGVSEHIRALAVEFQDRGHQVVVISGGARGSVHVDGPRVRRLGRAVAVPYNGSLSRFSLGWRLRSRLARILDEERLDVLHVHNPLMPTLPLAALSVAPCPVIATFHSCYESDRAVRLFRRPISKLLQSVAARIAVSAAAVRTAARDFPGEYRIIPNGVDVAFFEKARALRETRRERRPWKLLFVGALVRRKGVPLLIDCLDRLCQGGLDIELLIVGDGPELPGIARRVPARLNSRVRFFRSVSRERLLAAYAEADLLCAPSVGRESFGMVLLEAMAAGMPVVASDIDGYRDVIAPDQDGILLPPADAAAWAAEIRRLLGQPARMARLAEAGRRKAERYGWNAVAARVEEIYGNALGVSNTGKCLAPNVQDAMADSPAPSLV